MTTQNWTLTVFLFGSKVSTVKVSGSRKTARTLARTLVSSRSACVSAVEAHGGGRFTVRGG